MNVLEKVLEEIEERLNMVESIPVNEDDDFLDGEKCYEDGRTQGRFEELFWYRDIIRSHMDEAKDINVPSKDGWIPVEKKLPEVQEGLEDMYCPEFNVTIKGAEIATTLKYSWDGTWFDDYGTVYNVIAWQPLPERYKGGDDRA